MAAIKNRITLEAIDGGVRFTFENCDHYLQNGTIDVPLNSLSLIFDESDMATFRKAASNDIFISAPITYFYGLDTKEDLADFYTENMVGGTGGGIDPETLAELVSSAEYVSSSSTIDFKNVDGEVISTINAEPFITDGMVDNVQISGSNLVITFNVDAGKQPISIPLSSIFDPSNYYDKSATDTLLNGKVAVSDYNTYTANTNTALSGKADVSAVTAVSDALSGKQDTLVYYSEDEDNGIATIKCGGDDEQHADIQVALGDATITAMDMPEEDKYEYEQIVVYTNQIELNQGKLEYNEDLGEFEQVDYTHELTLNEDGIEINGDQIVTETALSDALSGKADTSAVTAAIDAAKAYYIDFGVLTTQGIHDADWDGMVAAINAHRPIYAGVPGTNGLLYYTAECLYQDGSNIIRMTASDNSAHYFYTFTKNGSEDYSFSYQTRPYTTDAEKAAWNAKADVSAVTAISDSLSGKQDTLVSGTNIKTINNTSLLGSGNIDIQGGGGSSSISSCTQAQYDAAEQGGTLDSDTMYVISDAPAVNIANYYTKTEVDDLLLNVDIDVDTAITAGGTNAVEGGAIYTALQGKADTNSVGAKLEWDATSSPLSYATLRLKNSNNTIISNTNLNLGTHLQYGYPTSSAINVVGLVETSAITTSMTSSSTDSQVPSAKAVYDALGGMTLMKLTQAQYDALVTKDPNTLYIITNVVNNA